jgi:ribosomal protein S18 acetylase RimI-like enzyme
VLNSETLYRLLVARQGTTFIGMTTLHVTANPQEIKLHWLAVVPSHQNQGLGRSLVVSAAREAICGRFEEMVLKTEIYRASAIALYRQLGFIER